MTTSKRSSDSKGGNQVFGDNGLPEVVVPLASLPHILAACMREARRKVVRLPRKVYLAQMLKPTRKRSVGAGIYEFKS